MHKETTALEWAGLVFVVLVAGPVILNGVVAMAELTFTGVSNGIEKLKFNRKIKKGLKEGSIVEIDGKYYEVVVDTVEEAYASSFYLAEVTSPIMKDNGFVNNARAR